MLASGTPPQPTAGRTIFFPKRGTPFFTDRPPSSSYRPRRVESKGAAGIPRQPITSRFVGYEFRSYFGQLLLFLQYPTYNRTGPTYPSLARIIENLGVNHGGRRIFRPTITRIWATPKLRASTYPISGAIIPALGLGANEASAPI